MALTTVGSSGITDGAVTSNAISDGVISVADVANYALTSIKLSNTGVVANTYGSSTVIPVLTIDGAGRVTSASNTSLTLGTISTQDSDNVTITGGSLSGNITSSNANITGSSFTGNITSSNVTITGGSFTGNITSSNANIAGGTVYGTSLGVNTVSSSSNVTTINYNIGSVFLSTVTENTTITPTNFPSAQGIVLLKLTNGGSKTISFAGNCGFVSNTAPTLTSSGTDFLFIQGNTTHYSVFTQLDVR